MTTINNLAYDPVGAHVTSCTTEFGDLFYLSSASTFGEGEAIRGGIPVIAPWFATFLGELQHGWARRQAWDITEHDAGYTARLRSDGLQLGLEVTTATNELSPGETNALEMSVTVEAAK
ncbi:Putative glucose-6-phosphate 1-epimerase [Actinobaculum suis]|uniref:Glucose-6-phosphate 1-epimerase n=1 Tax=Actinobaculum suis TaxID=1657 RepID=A0A1B9BBL5_9ACTO|nr:hypothetical protein [Actinobaculum suis]OCA93646.1 hypothetical protein ACU20_08325 [Actinobaculum suis]OCA94172.1 hypothetical protein ACU21_08550 [Actinobaculum suis]VDG76362.1 Putative glucose-6-phosphate 1-epimerase [Actinobaculum suis]